MLNEVVQFYLRQAPLVMAQNNANIVIVCWLAAIAIVLGVVAHVKYDKTDYDNFTSVLCGVLSGFTLLIVILVASCSYYENQQITTSPQAWAEKKALSRFQQ